MVRVERIRRRVLAVVVAMQLVTLVMLLEEVVVLVVVVARVRQPLPGRSALAGGCTKRPSR